jgi:hypothetical protein
VVGQRSAFSRCWLLLRAVVDGGSDPRSTILIKKLGGGCVHVWCGLWSVVAVFAELCGVWCGVLRVVA